MGTEPVDARGARERQVTITRVEPGGAAVIRLHLSDETVVELVPVEFQGASPIAVVCDKVLTALRTLLERARSV